MSEPSCGCQLPAAYCACRHLRQHHPLLHFALLLRENEPARPGSACQNCFIADWQSKAAGNMMGTHCYPKQLQVMHRLRYKPLDPVASRYKTTLHIME